MNGRLLPRWLLLALALLVVGVALLWLCRPSPPAVSHAEEERGPAWFEDVTDKVGLRFTHDAGPIDGRYFMPQSLGSGAALFDFDNDGLLDVYETNANQPSLLYRNRTPAAGHWLELKLVGTRSNRDAIGARVTAKVGGATLMREVNGGNGYSSQSSTRVHLGLGAATRIDELEVRWPSGLREKVAVGSVPIDRLSYVKEGSGVVSAAAAGFGRGARPASPARKHAAAASASAAPAAPATPAPLVRLPARVVPLSPEAPRP